MTVFLGDDIVALLDLANHERQIISPDIHQEEDDSGNLQTEIKSSKSESEKSLWFLE